VRYRNPAYEKEITATRNEYVMRKFTKLTASVTRSLKSHGCEVPGGGGGTEFADVPQTIRFVLKADVMCVATNKPKRMSVIESIFLV
jgi:hypothetical protein